LLVTQGAVSGATFVSVLFGLQAIQFGLGQLMETFGVILEQTVLLEGFMSYLELGPEEASGRHVGNPTGLIELKNVSFRYSPNASETLCGVTFRVEAGEHVAIVGANGAGKSTLARVIAGLFRATEGAVLWDGIDLWEWDRECIKRSIAWVFQDYLRYALPFAENVGCGLVSQVNDMGQVYAASRMAGADKIAEVLPHGYHTVLTTQFSGGVELSKGQWQRVALARSFMRKSPVIIFDEPTAALDPVTECEIVAGLLRFAEGRTAFIVSHRLGVARLCDRVIVLDNGRVVEHGTHDELLGRKGLYCGI